MEIEYDELSPSWSPDPTRLVLAYSSNRGGGDRDIFLVDLQQNGNTLQVNGSRTNLTTDSTALATQPSWSPSSGTNANKIAYVSMHDGNDEDVYAVKYTGNDCNSTTINVYPLTTSQDDEEFVTWYREGSQYKVT